VVAELRTSPERNAPSIRIIRIRVILIDLKIKSGVSIAG
jgi:hypothetical protein